MGAFLLENGDTLLIESGDALLLEEGSVAPTFGLCTFSLTVDSVTFTVSVDTPDLALTADP